MIPGFIVTGTDTGVGKTVFAAALAAHLGARYWKPVQAGLDEESDSAAVARLGGARLGGGRIACIHDEAYQLTTPCSPHEAARIDGVAIDPARLVLPIGAGPLIVEGAGGVLVPLCDDLLSVEIFAQWALPVVLVARTALGTINHSLLSLQALRARGLTIHGVAFVGDANTPSEAAIVRHGAVRHLGRLPLIDPLNANTLAAAFNAGFDAGVWA